jgi:glycosyltransferase involved in cell wall biosynthesis
MRILMLTPYLPYPLLSGGQVRSYNLLKEISKNHEVTLFSLIKDSSERENIPELLKFCSRVEVFERTAKPWHPRNILLAAVTPYPFVVTRNLVLSLRGAIAKELERQQYDLIHVETFYMMPSIPSTKVPTLLVEQTIEYLGYQQFADQIMKKMPLLAPVLAIDIAKITYWERLYWRTCKQLITVSEDDKVFIQEQLPQIPSIKVVSNGVDSTFFSETPPKTDPDPTLLFVGTFHWRPNVEAVEYLVKNVWPLVLKEVPNARLRIAGASPTAKIQEFAEKDDHITVTGRVPDIRDEYGRAHVLVAPVLSGKGTRYKVLEAMASQTPVVGTAIALEGIGAEPGKHCLIGNTPEELAQQTIKVLRDRKLQQALGKAGRAFVTERFSWSRIGKDLLRIYQETAADTA